MTLHHGDCLDVMAAMEPESVDAICTDPPYGIGFMGKAWDALSEGPVAKSWTTKGRKMTTATRDPTADTPQGRSTTSTGYPSPNPRCGKCGRAINGRDTAKGFVVCHCDRPDYVATPNRHAQWSQEWHQRWAEAAYRVAKPSAYLLAFGGTRTVHRMTVAIEDAGWIIRDMLVWAYASGFPKSKASLKPAWEPIVMARKPGPLRELAIDACRIPTDDVPNPVGPMGGHPGPAWRALESREAAVPGERNAQAKRDSLDRTTALGRWPANVILTETPDGGGIFDGGWDGVVGGGEARGEIAHKGNLDGRTYNEHGDWGLRGIPGPDGGYGDSGTYSRFFLIPKADRADREPVLGGLPEKQQPGDFPTYVCNVCGSRMVMFGDTTCGHGDQRRERGLAVGHPRQNSHPTVKPTELMRHLVRLVTPTGGVVLDCFAGSGSTLLAAEMEGFEWVGIEKEREYVRICEARLNGTQRGLGLDSPAPTRKRSTGGSLEETREKGYRHAVNDPAARSQVGALLSGLRKATGAPPAPAIDRSALAGALQDHESLNHGPLSCGLSCVQPVLDLLTLSADRLALAGGAGPNGEAE